MPIQALEQKKRQKTLLFVALGLVLATATVLYFGFFKSSGPITNVQIANFIPNAPGTSNTKSAGISEAKIKQINLDFDYLNNKTLSVLKVHGKVPVKVDEESLGRDNPFIPY